ncbi:serine hydrolase domain-containing protein [Paenibacillus pini]
MHSSLIERIQSLQNDNHFSGTVIVQNGENIVADISYGYANRSEKIENQTNTRYGIASGCKIFTSIAICQLVEQGKMSFHSPIKECLDINFPNFDDSITVHHLLTHTSGVADYFDEDIMDNFEELWVKTPMYHVRKLQDFLPLFKNEPMKFTPGSKFHYNNSGYILLGLIVEQASGIPFDQYVVENIFKKASMFDSGYFEMDALPARTAIGYIDSPDGSWRTNIYSLPAKGGSDGGAYVTATDMVKLWDALTSYQLLNEELTDQLLYPHCEAGEDAAYGYGVWIKMHDKKVIKYVLMGYDPGVNFRAAFYKDTALKIVVCSNQSDGAYEMISAIEDEWFNV